MGWRTLAGALVPPGWLSGLEERRSSVLEFSRWNVEGEAAEGEGRVGGAELPEVGAGVGFKPKEAGPGDGVGEGGTVLAGCTAGGPPGGG